MLETSCDDCVLLGLCIDDSTNVQLNNSGAILVLTPVSSDSNSKLVSGPDIRLFVTVDEQRWHPEARWDMLTNYDCSHRLN